ncbi:hypothetical protein BZG36_04858 [Bifiguratus adelaidae]|uniref:Uncharacterized protein n=1 Tax=Bifiguratus adelaidae TaxID=1938954 RepID=A0A261XVM0_9FUNG|nr:hypothetical protein BZG36_04858 [Bifiguratus adelaidae]
MEVLPIQIASNKEQILCRPHAQAVCTICDVDWSEHNALAATLKSTNGDTPPPNVTNPIRNQQVNRLREEGNKHFKAGKYEEAIRFYSMAIDMSWSRPLWEPMAFQFIREEVTTALSNRAAAYTARGQYVDALVDSEMCTRLRRDWQKGWFRKGKALVGLNRAKEALEAFELGRQFDPESEELRKAIEEVKAGFERGEYYE